MVFTSSTFIFIFLPITCILYMLASRAKSIKPRNIVLLICSLAFYAWGGIKYALLLIASTIVNFGFGKLIGKYKTEEQVAGSGIKAAGTGGRAAGTKRSKIILILGVIWNVGILFYFKYMHAIIPALDIVMPIGISFFTFQIMSYLFDVYYGTVPVQDSLTDLALYIMLFPQLIAGPIVRYSDVNEEIQSRRTSNTMLHDGILRFMMGFSKKIFLANTMGRVADRTFATVTWLNTGYAWLGIISYALQIYMDFSAYSDMAIGLGLMFGFHFKENFNYPYISQSVKEFWRRWHISLSSWFRDYVYIPLGGNRLGTTRTYINLFIVFLLTGIWHGAAWNFVLWGIYYAVILIIERAWLGKKIEKWPRIIRHIYTLLLVLIGWVLFRADTLADAVTYVKALFSFDFTNYGTVSIYEVIDKEYITMLVISVIVSMPVVKNLLAKTKENSVAALVCDCVIIGIFILAVLYMVGANYNPFIYFRF